jgi:hypothetical protein
MSPAANGPSSTESGAFHEGFLNMTRTQRTIDRAVNATLERLEERQMFALLGIPLGYPNVFFNSVGSTSYAYDGAEGTFKITALPLVFLASPTSAAQMVVTPRSLKIEFKLDGAGKIVGGAAGHDFAMTGSIDANGDGVLDPETLLLTGEIVQFGHADVAPVAPATVATDLFDFRFRPTGGLLAPMFAGQDVAVSSTSELSNFNGDFTTNFSGKTKGNVGPTAPLRARLGDYVWEDTNADGIQNDGNTGIGGVQLNLTGTDIAGNPITASTTTAADGSYLFDNLPLGTYQVSVDASNFDDGGPLAEYVASPLLRGGDTAKDANPTPTAPVSFPSGGEDLTLDFGYVRVLPPPGPPPEGSGGQGCTPGYWKQDQHFFAWTGYTQDQRFDDVFNVTSSTNPTLLEALGTGGGEEQALFRHATAALLNTANNGVEFGYTAAQVISMVQYAYEHGTFEFVKNLLAAQNEMGCGLGNGNGENPPPPPPSSASLSGYVYVDADNDGVKDNGEAPIGGVTITLTGTTATGQQVTRTMTTDASGFYSFTNLAPGTYGLTEIQPSNYLDGLDTIGTQGGLAGNDVMTNLVLVAGQNGVNNNFGERPIVVLPPPPVTGTLHRGQTATIGYWQNKNGQALLRSLNGGPTAKALGNWMASNFPNIWGNLAGKTNAQIADLFIAKFKLKGTKSDAQAMAVAFAIYATDSDLAGTTAVKYGFEVTSAGAGGATFNVGASGASFGVANGTVLSVFDLLKKADAKSAGNVLYGGNLSLLGGAVSIFDAINNAGDIY